MTSKAPILNDQGRSGPFAFIWTLVLGHSLVILVWSFGFAQSPTAPIFQTDFQQSAVNALPDDLKSLSGEFLVKQEGENRFLELTATPLNSFGVMIGPERGPDTSIRARIRGTPTGRRFPEFGVGLGGAGGYGLWLMPAVNELQIRQNSVILARVPLTWKPGTWVHFDLQVKSAGQDKWIALGKAWHEGDPEPAASMIQFEPASAPASGRPVLWGTPYSEKPIQFDDVRVDQ